MVMPLKAQSPLRVATPIGSERGVFRNEHGKREQAGGGGRALGESDEKGIVSGQRVGAVMANGKTARTRGRNWGGHWRTSVGLWRCGRPSGSLPTQEIPWPSSPANSG